MSDLLVDSKADGGGNPVPRPAPLELAEHSTSVEHSLWLLQPEPTEHPTDTPQLASVRTQCQRPAPSEIVEQPRSRERLLPETDTVPRPPPVALPGIVSDSRQSEDPAWMDRTENTGAVRSLVKRL